MANARISASIDMSAISGLRIFTALPALGPTATFIPLPETRASSLALMESFGRHAVAHARLVPANIKAVVQMGASRIQTLDLTKLRTIASGGSALHADIRHDAAKLIGVEIHDHYGMTETSGSFCHTSSGAMSETGAVANDILVRLVDADGAACQNGEVGHIRFFDACLSLGEYTAEGFVARPQGWFTSGDMGRRGKADQIIVAGRSDAMLKTREGEFLAPMSIINIVSALSGVQDAVVLPGKANDGADVYALVVETLDEHVDLQIPIRAAISDKLGPYAVPQQIILLQNMPRIAQSKPDLMALRKLVAAT